MRWTEADIKIATERIQGSWNRKNAYESKPNVFTQSEDDLQKNCVFFFRLKHPEYAFRFFAIPNGEYRGKVTRKLKDGSEATYSPAGYRLKQQGLLQGVWDIFLSVPRGGYSGLFIEMKSLTGTLSPEQIAFREANKNDYKFEVCKRLEEFEEIINKYLK